MEPILPEAAVRVSAPQYKFRAFCSDQKRLSMLVAFATDASFLASFVEYKYYFIIIFMHALTPLRVSKIYMRARVGEDTVRFYFTVGTR